MNSASAFLAALLACSLVCLSASAQAETIYLQDGWQASVTNVELLVDDTDFGLGVHWTDGFPWHMSFDSSLIAVEADEWGGAVDFNMSAGPVLGQEDAYINVCPLTPNYIRAIQFDWTTNWSDWGAAEHIRFELWGSHTIDMVSFDESEYIMYDSFYPGYGLRSGHAYISISGGAAPIELHLVAAPAAIPEPSCLLLLAAGLPVLGAMRRWR